MGQNIAPRCGMKRDIKKLTNTYYDVLVIGSGIHGATAAWDASLRGLSVALIDKGDIGSGTSSNSQKTIHGGLRYLQNLDLKRTRESIYERMVMMRIAPHLVHPLPCVMPTSGYLVKGKAVMFVALKINDLIGVGRNRLDDPQKFIPDGKILSLKEFRALLPGIEKNKITGAALWYDAQVYNSERLVLAFVISASQAGAEVANYVRVVGFLKDKNKIIGVKARDELTGDQFEIRAKMVVNNSGPWAGHVLELLDGRQRNRKIPLCAGYCLLTRRQIVANYGIGLQSSLADNSRLIFITPWRNYSLVGTTYEPYAGDPDQFRIKKESAQNLLDQFNVAYGSSELSLEDVLLCYGGILPLDKNSHDISPARHPMIIDHKRSEGLDGLISVVGVKYTTARHLAQKTIDLVFKKLGKTSPKCLTASKSLYGGEIENFAEFLNSETHKNSNILEGKVCYDLIHCYGTSYAKVIENLYKKRNKNDRFIDRPQILEAQIQHAVRKEMALKLSDVVFRRTGLGSEANASDKMFSLAANVMAKELAWNDNKVAAEIDDVKAKYSFQF
jgi:glycerol-3-phosphate dehydrogenase